MDLPPRRLGSMTKCHEPGCRGRGPPRRTWSLLSEDRRERGASPGPCRRPWVCSPDTELGFQPEAGAKCAQGSSSRARVPGRAQRGPSPGPPCPRPRSAPVKPQRQAEQDLEHARPAVRASVLCHRPRGLSPELLPVRHAPRDPPTQGSRVCRLSLLGPAWLHLSAGPQPKGFRVAPTSPPGGPVLRVRPPTLVRQTLRVTFRGL